MAEPRLVGPLWGWRKLGWKPRPITDPAPRQLVACSCLFGYQSPGCASGPWLDRLENGCPLHERWWAGG